MTEQRLRLPEGGLIDRTRPISFRFDGKAYRGYAGDTLASALLANGVRLLARSFKYHRPRGLMGAGEDEPNALVAIGDGARADTNLQATGILLREGLEARSLNAWPTLRFDIGAVADLAHAVIPAGFYYKTFMWPRWSWFEGAIRCAAGIGHAPAVADADRYVHRHLHRDVLVLGGGPAGLAAALAASRTGLDVVLIDKGLVPGGTSRCRAGEIGGRPAAAWSADTSAALERAGNVTLLRDTVATGLYAHDYVLAVSRNNDTLYKIRAQRIVMATGTLARPLVFPGNDRPGVMLARAAERYAAEFGVAPGRNVLLATDNDDGYRIAESLTTRGVRLCGIIDLRSDGDSAAVGNIPLYSRARVLGTAGRHRLSHVDIEWAAPGGRKRARIPADALLMCGGASPNLALLAHDGAKLRFDPERRAFLAPADTGHVAVAGSAAGAVKLTEVLDSGWKAGADAASAISGKAPPPKPDWQASGPAPDPWAGCDPDPAPGRAFVDFHNDVTTADIALAARENFVSVEHVKRYTTLGMAPDQGKTSNANGIAVLAAATARAPGEIGTTTFRPPYVPVKFGAIAGRHCGTQFQPPRRLPTHDRLAACGAVFDDYGPWQRPAFFPLPGESEDRTIAREVKAVRNGAGILDYSSLGKIEIAGPDAPGFLNRFTTTDLRTLKPGRARYNLMLSELGIVIDDGTISRLGENHFLVQTTSGAGLRIREHFERWRQTEWRQDRVEIVDVSSAWGIVMVTGPRARDAVRLLGSDIDFAPEAFPHLSLRTGRLGGRPLRVHRVSFTGELTYELAVPAGCTAALWDRLAAQPGIIPFGLESLQVMRIEKGYLHVGTDSDGTSTPDDLGYGAMARRKSVDFVGRRSLDLADARRPDRFQLVGLQSDRLLPIGGILLSERRKPADTEGYVTSSVMSPTLDRPLALGLLARGRERMGEPVQVYSDGAWHTAKVAAPQFFDPTGVRQNG